MLKWVCTLVGDDLQVQTVAEPCQDCSFFGLSLSPMAGRTLRIPMMSYAEKPDDITKEEWMEKLNNVHIQRADMNRLIMNYLVTGEACPLWLTWTLQPGSVFLFSFPCGLSVFRGIQRGGGEVPDGVWDRAERGPGHLGREDKDSGDDPEGTDTGGHRAHQQPASGAARYQPILVFPPAGTCTFLNPCT